MSFVDIMKQDNKKREIRDGILEVALCLKSTWHLVSHIAYQQHSCPVTGVSYCISNRKQSCNRNTRISM